MITYADYQRIAESMLGEYEPENRTAVSRTYYAAYHACQNKYTTAPDTQGGMHRRFIQGLMNSHSTLDKRIGFKLNAIYAYRLTADYRLADHLLRTHANDCIKHTADIIELLK